MVELTVAQFRSLSPGDQFDYLQERKRSRGHYGSRIKHPSDLPGRVISLPDKAPSIHSLQNDCCGYNTGGALPTGCQVPGDILVIAEAYDECTGVDYLALSKIGGDIVGALP